MPSITPKEFFDTVFYDLTEDEQIFCSTFDHHPQPGDPWWHNSGPKAMGRRKVPHCEYFCTSTVLRAEKPRRNADSLQNLHVVVLDDVGQKVDSNPLTPSYRVETSPGNEQWGYLLTEPVDARTIGTQLIRAVYTNQGLTDEGGKMAAKMVRPPFGVNFKYDGDPEVQLLEWNPDVHYTVDELVEAWNLDLDAIPETSAPESVIDVPHGALIEDEVLEWFREQGMVVGDDGGDWVDIKCPWHDKHGSPGETAGYNPLGRGRPEFRGYNCFHDSCSERKTADLLGWVAEEGGPVASVRDVVAVFVQRYALLKASNEVADLTAPATAIYPIIPLSHWRAAHKQVAWVSDRGKQFYVCDEWQSHPNLHVLDGLIYRPGQQQIVEEGQHKYFNTYRAPDHPVTRQEPAWFLDHVDHVIPDPDQADMFLDWLAYKVQNPGKRSYAVIMVADFGAIPDGDRFGIGRSMIGRAMRRVFQTGVETVDLDDVIGKGSQSAYNDWVADNQLVVVEETKEEVGDWKTDVNHYERIKSFVDPAVIEGVRVKPKYGRIRVVDLYFNMMMFTNHADAIAMPEGDRRFLVLGNNTTRRTKEEYAEVVQALEDSTAIAQLYNWLMQREIVTDMVFPVMTEEKRRMTAVAATTIEEAWAIAMSQIEGDLVTRKHLMHTMEHIVSNEFEDEKMVNFAKSFASRKYRSLPCLVAGGDKNSAGRPYDNKKKIQHKCGIIRNVKHWQDLWREHHKDPTMFLDELAKNTPSSRIRNLK